MTVVVRPAVISDAPGLARVHVQAWTEAYAHLVPAEALARQSVEQRALRWSEIIGSGSPVAWVAIDAGTVIGFGSAGVPRGDDPPRALELEALYLLESHYGSGAGQRLLDAAVGDRPAFLWVATDNPRARAFYDRNRFAPDGAVTMHSLAGTAVEASRLVR